MTKPRTQTKWPTRSLAECGEWVSGGTPSKSVASYWNGNIPWISSKSLKSFDLSDSEDRITNEAVENGTALVPKGTVIFVVRGMSLANEFRVGITTRPLAFNQDLRAIIPAADMDGRYLTHYLKAKEQIILGLTNNATHGTKRLPTELVETISVPVPPLPEQRRIAAILDKAGGIRRKRQEGIRLTEELLRSTFLEMFGERDEFCQRWKLVSFGDLVTSTKLGLVRGSPQITESGAYPYLRMDGIVGDGTLRLSPIKRTDASDFEASESRLHRNDFLFNTRNSRELVGKTALFESDDIVLFNNNIMRVRFVEAVQPAYILGVFQTSLVQQQLDARKSGTTSVFAIYAKELNTIQIPVPPRSLQDRYCEVRNHLVAQKTRRVDAHGCTKTLFDSLVQRAFRGEL